MPRFAILLHDWPIPHHDFFLEAGATLRSWRLLGVPCLGAELVAEPTADHRKQYLDYEGPVSNNRGVVTRYDAGTFQWLVDTAECVEVELHGVRLVAVARIVRTADGWVCRISSRDTTL